MVQRVGDVIADPVFRSRIIAVGTSAGPASLPRALRPRRRISRCVAVLKIGGVPRLRKRPTSRPRAERIFDLREVGVSPRRREVDGVELPFRQRRGKCRDDNLSPRAKFRRRRGVNIVSEGEVDLERRVLTKLQVHRLETGQSRLHRVVRKLESRTSRDLKRPKLARPGGRREHGRAAPPRRKFRRAVESDAAHVDSTRRRRFEAVLRIIDNGAVGFNPVGIIAGRYELHGYVVPPDAENDAVPEPDGQTIVVPRSCATYAVVPEIESREVQVILGTHVRISARSDAVGIDCSAATQYGIRRVEAYDAGIGRIVGQIDFSADIVVAG